MPRRPDLARWLKRECAYLTGIDGFNVRKLAAAAQQDSPRAVHPLLLACIIEGKTSYLMQFVHKENVKASYESTMELLEGQDLQQLAKSKQWPEGLQREYWKHLDLWDCDYQKPELNKRVKESLRTAINDQMIETGMTAASVCKRFDINEGNFSAFRRGRLDAVAQDKLRSAAIWLKEISKSEASR